MNTTPAAANVLLPCPFCGNKSPSFERTGTLRQSCIVACGSCGCRLESGDEGSDSGRTWNERAAPATGDLSALNDDLIAILGRPNFTCIRLAQALRLCGVEIKSKAEHEQAAVIHFLLMRYMRHGTEWATHADTDLRTMLNEVEAKNKAAMTPEPDGEPLEAGDGGAR